MTVRPGLSAPGGAPRSAGAAGVTAAVLVCASGVLSAALELFFVPVYLGSVLAPFTVAAALLGGIALPLLGRAAAGTAGSMLPVLFWLVTLVGLALVPRPEGDVLVLGGNGQEYVFYAVLLVGAAAGFGTVVITSTGQRASYR